MNALYDYPLWTTVLATPKCIPVGPLFCRMNFPKVHTQPPFKTRVIWVPGTHRIHVVYIYLHENHKNQPNVGKYASPMDPMGYTRIGLDFFYYKSSLHTTTIGPLGLRVFLMTIGQSFANHGVLSLGSGGTLVERDPVTSLEGDDYMIHVVPQSRTWMS